MAAGESDARLRDEVAALRREVRELRDEVARLRVAQPAPSMHPALQTPWTQDPGPIIPVAKGW